MQQQLNLLATLFVSQGVPMLAAGTELGHTQKGNNNAYCQDSRLGWLNWDTRDAQILTAAVRRLSTLRRQQPVLRQRRYLHGRFSSRSSGLADVAWLDARAGAMDETAWHDGHGAFLALLLAVDPGLLNLHIAGARGDVAADEDTAPGALLALFNTGARSIRFPLDGDLLPQGRWDTLWDSASHVQGLGFASVALAECTHVEVAAKSVWIGRCYT